MDKILESKQLRRVFLLLFGSLFIIAILLRWLAIGRTAEAGELKQAFARILDGYISTSIVTTAIGLVIYIGTSQIRKASAQIEVLPSGDISKRFVAAQQKTRIWYFKGGLGRYFTSETIPNTLKNGGSGYRFRAYLVDPFNEDLCEYVASHRDEGQTGADIKIEALVTIADFVRNVHSRRVAVAEARCGLIDDFSPLRIDLTDEGVFITHDNASAPAMFYRNESPFYSSYEQELTTGPNSYAMIDLMDIVDKLSHGSANAPTVVDETYAKTVLDAVTERLRDISTPGPVDVSEEEIKAVAKIAGKRKSPY
jgi:hypothetical protein